MMNDFIMHALRQCPLFMGMSEVSIELALGSINYQVVSLEKRDVYALAGMPVLPTLWSKVRWFVAWLRSAESKWK